MNIFEMAILSFITQKLVLFWQIFVNLEMLGFVMARGIQRFGKAGSQISLFCTTYSIILITAGDFGGGMYEG